MAYSYITATGAALVAGGYIRKAIIQVNTALTGTIAVADSASATGTANVATITNPTVGSRYEYWDFKNGVSVAPSATTDITVSVDGSFGPK